MYPSQTYALSGGPSGVDGRNSQVLQHRIHSRTHGYCVIHWTRSGPGSKVQVDLNSNLLRACNLSACIGRCSERATAHPPYIHATIELAWIRCVRGVFMCARTCVNLNPSIRSTLLCTCLEQEESLLLGTQRQLAQLEGSGSSRPAVILQACRHVLIDPWPADAGGVPLFRRPAISAGPRQNGLCNTYTYSA